MGQILYHHYLIDEETMATQDGDGRKAHQLYIWTEGQALGMEDRVDREKTPGTADRGFAPCG